MYYFAFEQKILYIFFGKFWYKLKINKLERQLNFFYFHNKNKKNVFLLFIDNKYYALQYKNVIKCLI